MPEQLLQYGLAGVVMGGVMYLVVKPLVNITVKQIEAATEERRTICARHHEFHEQMRSVMEGLLESVDALVKRANGGQ